MARPRKLGLEYFPMNTVFNDRVEMLQLEHGNDAIVAWLFAIQELYRSDEGVIDCSLVIRRKTLGKRVGIPVEQWEAIIQTAAEIGLFDLESWKEFQLKSAGVSKRLNEVAQSRAKERKKKHPTLSPSIPPVIPTFSPDSTLTKGKGKGKGKGNTNPLEGGAGGEGVCEEDEILGESGREVRELALEILAAYPRQVGLEQGLPAVVQELQEHEPELLLQRTEQFAAAMAGTRKQFIPFPARWFSERRFLEDPAEWASTEAPTNGWITREQLLQMSQKDSKLERRLECWEVNNELVYRHPTADPPPAGYRNLYSPPSTHAPPENGTTHNGAPPIPDE